MFVVGVALVLLGIALIPLPGPFSIPLMIAGLAVLATEYVWAERVLDTVKDRGQAGVGGRQALDLPAEGREVEPDARRG